MQINWVLQFCICHMSEVEGSLGLYEYFKYLTSVHLNTHHTLIFVISPSYTKKCWVSVVFLYQWYELHYLHVGVKPQTCLMSFLKGLSFFYTLRQGHRRSMTFSGGHTTNFTLENSNFTQTLENKGTWQILKQIFNRNKAFHMALT